MEEEEVHKLHSVRTSFFNHILKRPHSKPVSIRYEDTQPIEHHPVMFTNGRFKFKKAKTDEMEFEQGPADKTSLIVRFYDPKVNAHDAAGRTLDEILEWENRRLEQCHNYIQMLFPLPEGSPFNFEAPVIDREVMEAFRSRPELQDRLRVSFRRILDFYGFAIAGDEGEEEEEEEEEGQNHEENVGEHSEMGSGQPTIANKGGAADSEMEGHVEAESKHSSVSAAEVEIQDVEATQGLIPGYSQEDTSIQTSTVPSATSAQPLIEADANPSHRSSMGADRIGVANGTTTEISTEAQSAEQSKPAAKPKASLLDDSSDLIIIRSPYWNIAFRNWAIRFDHNHLRITRILRSLRVLGLEEECVAFYIALKQVYDDENININERSMMYWKRAATGPLHVAPDGEQILWLKRWKEEQVKAKQEANAMEQAEKQAMDQDEDGSDH